MGELNWLDITVIVILIVFMAEGLIKGFVIALFNTISVVAAFIAARILSPYLENYISQNTYIYNKIYDYCNQKLPKGDAASFAIKLIGGDSIGSTLANGLILMVSFAAIFILVRLIIFAISRVLNTVSKLPVLRQFNRLGGLLFGLLKGVLIVYVIFAVMTPVLTMLKPSDFLVDGLNKSHFAVNFYKYNIIITVLNNKLH